MTDAAVEQARAACEALCKAYGPAADAGDGEALANLFTPDGVFNRLGTEIAGRAAIRAMIASRPVGVWTQHQCSNVRIEIAADGRSASGKVDLQMRRGSADGDSVDEIRAEYTDRYVLTDEGWRIRERKVVMV